AAIEHGAVGELVLVDRTRGHGQMLPFALGVGEAEVDPVDLLVLNTRKDSACVGRHVLFPLSIKSVTPARMPRARQQPGRSTRIGLGRPDSRRRAESQSSRE